MADTAPHPLDTAVAGSEWQTLAGRPETWLDSAQLAAVLATDEPRAQAISRQPRFRARVLAQICRRHALPDPGSLDINDADALVIACFASDADRLIRLCGVLAHANTLKSEIRASRVRGLRESIDETLWHQAIVHGDTAIEPLTDTQDVAAFMSSVDARGADCLAGWVRQCPPPLAAWLAMTTARALGLAGSDPAPRHRDHGPAIVRLAATLHPLSANAVASPKADT